MRGVIRLTHIGISVLLLACAAGLPLRAHAADQKADERSGAVLFRDKGCAHCHGANGEGTAKAPPVANIRTDKKWPVAKIKDQILNGGAKMPPFSDSLSDPEIDQIITFMRAKHWPTPPPAPSAN
jgi:mono/diheme cytochrome c family protein